MDAIDVIFAELDALDEDAQRDVIDLIMDWAKEKGYA